MNKNYKLTYRIVRMNPETEVGPPGASIPSGAVGVFTELIEDTKILTRMKEIQDEHNNNVRGTNLPPFARFYPIEEFSMTNADGQRGPREIRDNGSSYYDVPDGVPKQ